MAASTAKFTPRQTLMQQISVNDIEKKYTSGQITYAQRGELLRAKAIQVNADAFGDQGYMHAVYKKTLEQVEKGWENIKEAGTLDLGATEDITEGPVSAHARNIAYAAGLNLWGQIQILNSIPTAVGEVTGLVAERIALQNGASAGTAAYIRIITDIGTQFVPVGVATRGGVQLAQKGIKATERLTRDVEDATRIRSVVEEAIDVSLKIDGVETTVFSKAEAGIKKAAQQAGLADKTGRDIQYSIEGVNIITPSGKAINRTTGEVIESGVKPGAEFEVVAQGVKVRVSRMHTAQEIAARKLGVPREQVADMLSGWAPEAVGRGNMEEAAEIFIKDVEKISLETLKNMLNQLRNERGSTTLTVAGWGQAVELYRNLLLANPAGRTRDLLSNVVSGTVHLANRQIGALFSLTGRQVVGTEANYYYAKGMTLAWHEALDSAASAFASGGAGLAGVTRFDKPLVRQIPGHIGNFINIPTSITVGIDRAFKTSHRRGSLFAQELEAADRAGRPFDMWNVDLPPKLQWDKAVKDSDYLTFQNDLGYIGTRLQQGLQFGPLELYFTFMKTPINLGKWSWNEAPGLQLASKRLFDEIKAGGEVADTAMGRLINSNMFGLYISELVKAEMITGSGPADPAARAEWSETHEPYSIRFGDRWVNLEAIIGALTPTVGMIADYTQIMSELDTPSLRQGAHALMLTIERNMGEDSWWGNVKELTKAISTLGRSDTDVQRIEKAIGAPFVTMGTGGSLGSMAKQFIDPVPRDTRGLIDSFMAKTPMWSTTVPPRRDGYGDVVIPPMAIGGRWAGIVNPIKIKEAPKDRMRLEGDRLKVKLPYFGNSIGGSTHEFDLKEPQPGDKLAVGITPQQKDQWKQIYGNFLEHPTLGMNALMDTEEYQKASDALRRQMFQGHTLEAQKFAEEALMLKHKELGIKAVQNEAAQWLPQLESDAARHEAQWQFKSAIEFFENLTDEEINNILKYTTE